MRCHFHKLHGLGNDVMLIDTIENERISISDMVNRKTIRAWSDRHTGIGFDQLLVLERQQSPWQLRFYNADGGVAEQCGNGLRATALWLDRQGYLDATKPASLVTSGQIITLGKVDTESDTSGLYYADLPAPVLVGELVDYQRPPRFQSARAITVGNPHLVIICDEPNQHRQRYGAQLVNDQQLLMLLQDDRFEHGCNISFMRIVENAPDAKKVDLSVWERGAGPTHACGSAACAVAAAVMSKSQPGGKVEVSQPGGNLMLEYVDNTTLRMSGSAAYVYSGTVRMNS